MRRLRSQRAGDVDMVDVILGEDEAGDTVDAILWQDESTDEFLAVLHQIALEAMALRAHSPGDPRTEVDVREVPGPSATDGRARIWLIRRLGRRRVAQVAVIAAAALAVALVPGVLDANRAVARLAALEATPGVLGPTTGPPVELWRTVVTDATGRTVDLRSGALRVGDLALDLAIGEELDAEEALREPVPHEEYALPGGARATWSWDPDGDSGQGAVTRQDGGWAFELWGPPLVPAITDES